MSLPYFIQLHNKFSISRFSSVLLSTDFKYFIIFSTCLVLENGIIHEEENDLKTKLGM